MSEDELMFKDNKLSVGQAFRNQRNDNRQFSNGTGQFPSPNGHFQNPGGYQSRNNAYRNNDAFRSDNLDAGNQYNNMKFAYDQQYGGQGGFFRN